MHNTINLQIIGIKNKLAVKKSPQTHLLLHLCYTHYQLYPTWFVHPNTIRWRV